MKETPILFSTPMVQAILEKRKTQTRRIISERNSRCTSELSDLDFNDVVFDNYLSVGNAGYLKVKRQEDDTCHRLFCRYEIGDIFWVRETFLNFHGKFFYKATEGEGLRNGTTGHPVKWKPSIFMPREASRISLEITNVQAQRLNDISEHDAMQEGDPKQGLIASENTHVDWYMNLWESINGKDSWKENPYVWVISFKRIEK